MSRHKETHTEDRQRYWRGMIERWRSSGLSVRQFCREQGFSQASFYAWRRRLASPAPEAFDSQQNQSNAGFIEVSLPANAAAPLELLLPSGAVLRIPAGTEPALLGRVLGVLGEAQLC